MESRQRRESSYGPAAPSSTAVKSSTPPPVSFGRYVLHAPIARGGMATIYIARLIGAEGFSRIVAAKRLHPQLTNDPDFVAMSHDEARIASRIHHPNVVPVLDVVLEGPELVIVQEYVHGVPLDKLFRGAIDHEEPAIPVPIVSAIMTGVLAGLDAAHETKDEMGVPLAIVHRDVSPQNVMVSLEGVPRILDFGIAKARSNEHVTREGFFKGKVAYMAPEQLRAEAVTRSADVYACGVMLWELLANRRLHSGRGEAEMFHAVLSGAIPSLSSALEGDAAADSARWRAAEAFEPVVARALSMKPAQRYPTAAEMLRAVARACPPATASEVAEWVRVQGVDYIERRQAAIAASEESWRSHSRIAAAPVLTRSETPESIARLVSGTDPLAQAALAEARVPREASRLAATAYESPLSHSSAAPPFVSRNLPWLVAGGLLIIVGVLLGLLTSRAPSEPAVLAPPATLAAPPPPDPASTSAASAPAPASAAADPPLPTAARSAPHPTVSAPPPVHALPPTRAPAPSPPPRPVAPAASHPAPAASHPALAAPPASPPPSPQPTASAKADCDPPFYFDGAKKVFKPACL